MLNVFSPPQGMRYIPNTVCVRACVKYLPHLCITAELRPYVFLCTVCACVTPVLTTKHISVGNNCTSLVQPLAVHQYWKYVCVCVCI